MCVNLIHHHCTETSRVGLDNPSDVTFILLTHPWNILIPISEEGNQGTEKLRTGSAMSLIYIYNLSTPSYYGSHRVLVLFPSKWGRAFKKDFLVDSQHNLMAFTHLTCSNNTKALNKYSWDKFLDANSWLFTPDVYNLYTINVFNMKIPALSFSLISLVLPVLFNLPVVCSPTCIKSISNTPGAVGIWALPICSL